MKCMIVCTNFVGSIGHEGGLPWNIPTDKKWFKDVTMGQTVIMGRKTFESLPNGPLKGRVNVVISSKLKPQPGIIIFQSLEEAFEYIEGEPCFLIGGKRIYEEGIKYASCVILTRVQTFSRFDTRVQILRDLNLRSSGFEISMRSRLTRDHKTPFFRFIIYEREENNFISDEIRSKYNLNKNV